MSGILTVIRNAALLSITLQQVTTAPDLCRVAFVDHNVVAQTAAFAVCGFRVDEGEEPRTSTSEDCATC